MDKKLRIILDNVLREEFRKVTLYLEGVLRIESHISVLNASDLVKLIMEEAHSTKYFTFLGVEEMNHDLKNIIGGVGLSGKLLGLCLSV